VRLHSEKDPHMAHDSTGVLPSPATGAALEAHTFAILAALVERQKAMPIALARMANDAEALAEVAARLVAVLRAGGKILVAGNGGSAAEAQHFAAELVGRFKRERAPWAALALTTDTSILTAVGNDYGYGEVFARQVAGLGKAGDAFLAYSTSGESENLLRAATVAHERGMGVFAVTGARTSSLARRADVTIRVPLSDTALTQELQMAVTHVLCDIVEGALAET
jgi:D-sedoheptulose 7-phosphate isomerase